MNRAQSKSAKKEDKKKSNNPPRKCSTAGKKKEESKGKKFMNMLRSNNRASSPKSPSSPQQRTEESIVTSVHLGPPGQALPQTTSGYFSTAKKKPKKSPHHTERTNEVELPTSKEIGNFFTAPFRRMVPSNGPVKKPVSPAIAVAKHSTPSRPAPYVGSPANSSSMSQVRDDVELPKCSAETTTMRTETCLSREKMDVTMDTIGCSRERIDIPTSRETCSKEKGTGKYFPRVSNRAPLKDPPSHLVPTIFETVNAPIKPVTENPKFIHKQAQERRRKILADIVAARHEHRLSSSLPEATQPQSSSNEPTQIQSAPEFSNRSDAEKLSDKLAKSSKSNAPSPSKKKSSTSTQDSKTDKTETSMASPRKKKTNRKKDEPPPPPPPPPPAVFNPSAENISINVTMDNIAPQELHRSQQVLCQCRSLLPPIVHCPRKHTVLRLCKLTFEDAMDTRNCYDNGMIRFSGSPEEAACRQKCCHDSSTFNASEPLLCGPGRDILFSQYFFDIYSDVEGDPDFDELTNELFSDVTPGIMIDLLTTAGALRYVYMHEVCAMIDTRRKNIADTRASGPYVSIADGKILNDQPGQ
uniref:Kunitz/Bovine pancreatic trypsin inhibitor domain protein n=1 Tax=Panagrellus redivivus TaxID=6233 RepID=A0A7E4VSR6_PANRE